LNFYHLENIFDRYLILFFALDRDSDGYNVFTIDPITGMIRTKAVLDHEERNVYRVSVKATDAGHLPRHSIRALRVEVLALADNRPTFTSSSLTFNVSIIALTIQWNSFTCRNVFNLLEMLSVYNFLCNYLSEY